MEHVLIIYYVWKIDISNNTDSDNETEKKTTPKETLYLLWNSLIVQLVSFLVAFTIDLPI